MKEKLQTLIEKSIADWDADGIYAISLYVNDEEDNPFKPAVVLGYNTEQQVAENLQYASDEQEARWNYAFWLQNEELYWGVGDSAEDVQNWLSEQDLWDREENVTEAFVGVLIEIVKDIHKSGLLASKYGREIPILIHELEYYDVIAQQNIRANGKELVKEFAEFCE